MVADSLKKIEVWWLKKHGYFKGYKFGAMQWKNYWGESSIGINMFMPGKDDDFSPYMQLHYTITDQDGSKRNFDYNVSIVATPCHFGRWRYWFLCPLTTNGQVCNRRVGVLYKGGDYFGCRHCYNLAYAVQNYGGMEKANGKTVGLFTMEEMKDQIKRTRYKGKWTKRYLRYVKLRNKNWGGFMAASCALDAKSGQRADFWRKVGKPWQEFYKSKRGAKLAKKRKPR